MGVNYYLYSKPPCECCNRPYEPKHIGKSSIGWCFNLHVIPKEGINDLDNWLPLFNQEGAIIKDEYERPVTPEEMLAVITIRFSKPKSREESAMRYAQPGPNYLWRNEIDNVHCIKHGKGTWDCIVGEFS